MRRLICAFVVRIWHKTHFRMTWSNWSQHVWSDHVSRKASSKRPKPLKQKTRFAVCHSKNKFHKILIYWAKIESLHVIVACPCEQGRENIIVLFIFEKVEPLAMPRFDPFRFFVVTIWGRDSFWFLGQNVENSIIKLHKKTRLSRSKIPYNHNELLICPCLQRTQGNCHYCCENKGCELSAKFSFTQSELGSQWKSHRQFNSSWILLHEKISFNMYHHEEWKIWHVKNSCILIAREIILSLNSSFFCSVCRH